MSDDHKIAQAIKANLNAIFTAIYKGEIPAILIPTETLNGLLQARAGLRAAEKRTTLIKE